jgi:hypothetical protein
MTTTNKIAAVSGDTNSAVFSERVRVAAILESPEGKRNPAMAAELALRTALDAEQARAILATAPAANPYIAAMNREGPIGLDAPTADMSGDPKAARLAEINGSMQAFNAVKGYTKAKG